MRPFVVGARKLGEGKICGSRERGGVVRALIGINGINNFNPQKRKKSQSQGGCPAQIEKEKKNPCGRGHHGFMVKGGRCTYGMGQRGEKKISDWTIAQNNKRGREKGKRTLNFWNCRQKKTVWFRQRSYLNEITRIDKGSKKEGTSSADKARTENNLVSATRPSSRRERNGKRERSHLTWVGRGGGKGPGSSSIGRTFGEAGEIVRKVIHR